MARFVARRLLFAVLLIVAASTASLLLTRLAPGDVSAQLGPFAKPSEVAAARARLDLDQSPMTQVRLWASRAIRFDFGTSFLYNRPVLPLVRKAAINTAVLGLAALIAATIVGIGLGIFTGSRSDGIWPGVIRTGSIACLSLPPLVTSLLLVYLAARTGWLPSGGMSSIEALNHSGVAWLIDVAWHLPLPVIALALPLAATFERLQSQSVAEQMRQPFVLAAAARGVPRERIVIRYAWRTSLPAICGVYGVAIGTLLSGSFIVEYITAWPGLGRLMYEALLARDIYLVAGCAAAGAAFLACGTLLGDILLLAADPRVADGDLG